MAGKIVTSKSAALTSDRAVDITPFQGHGAPLGAPEPREEGVNFSRYISALKRYRWLMLLILLLGTTLGVVATKFVPPEYMATATIWIEDQGGRSGPLRSGELFNQFAATYSCCRRRWCMNRWCTGCASTWRPSRSGTPCCSARSTLASGSGRGSSA
ncbi:MAG: hypothetical protein IPO73_11430 [Gemmatimonadetes bacterium]|nr:hypothetical protein [Gemmatimonadota bacterium]